MTEMEIINEIRSKFPNISFPDVWMEPVWTGNNPRNFKRVEDQKSIWASVNDGEPVHHAFVSEQYSLLTNEIAIHQVLKKLEEDHPEFGEPDLKVRFSDGMQRMFATFTFPKVETYEITKGDGVQPTITLGNSTDKSLMYNLNWGAVQLVCTNGLKSFVMKEKLASKHKYSSLKTEDSLEVISLGLHEFSHQVGIWKEWAKKELGIEEYDQFWVELPFGRRHREQILALPRKQDGKTLQEDIKSKNINLWRLYSSITQFITHEIKSVDVSEKKSEEVTSIIRNRFAVA